VPEKLFQDIINNWLQLKSVAEEAEISRKTARLLKQPFQDAISEFFISLWLKRPLRITELLVNHKNNASHDYFYLLDKELARIEKALRHNYYAADQLKKAADLCMAADETAIAEHLNRQIFDYKTADKNISMKNYRFSDVFVPLVIDSGNSESLPKLYFDSFHTGLALHMNKNNQTSPAFRHSAIRNLFSCYYPGHELSNFFLPLLSFSFSGLQTKGFSSEVGLWVKLWLSSNNCSETLSLCCTGSIDEKTGKILHVDKIREKIDAAMAAGFDFCLIPADCQHEINGSTNHKVKFFGHVEELNNWLFLNTGTRPANRKVSAWLKTSRKEPEQNDLKSFVTQQLNNKPDFINYWQNCTLNSSAEERAGKLQKLVETAFTESLREHNSLQPFLPDYLWLSLLPWLLMQKTRSEPAAAEQLYVKFSARFTDSDPEIYLASRMIHKNHGLSLLGNSYYKVVRQRFPLALWLFFRDPVEMLLAFSLFSDFTCLEAKVMQSLLRLLESNISSYMNISENNRTDADIMQNLLHLYDEEAIFVPGPVLAVRKRLIMLKEANNNFIRQGDLASAKFCRRFFLQHLFSVAEKISFSPLQYYRQTFCKRTIRPAISLKKLSPAFIDLEKAELKKNHANFSAQPRIQSILQAPEGRGNCRTWLPQPGIAFLEAIRTGKWLSFRFFDILHQFSRENFETPATELRKACLANWAGKITSMFCNKYEDFYSSSHFRNSAGLKLPFWAGWKQQSLALANSGAIICSSEEKAMCQNYLINNAVLEKTGALNHFWFATLPEICIECLKKTSIFATAHLSQNVTLTELQMKNETARLMGNNLIYKKIADSEWGKTLSDFEENPFQIRRTAQALIPVYYFFKDSFSRGAKACSKLANSLNSSLFAITYLENFHKKPNPEINVYPEMPLSLDRQIYASIYLGYNSLFHPEKLDQMLFHDISDLNNLDQAIKLRESSNRSNLGKPRKT